MRNAKSLHARAWIALIVTSAFHAVPSMAKTQENAETVTSGELQDIVVTAQRRSERLQDVPISVTAITSERLQAASIGNTMDLAVVTPGLYIGNASGYLRPTIRGVGTAAAGPGTENSVATYVDGVYLVSQPSALVSLGDIQRVEVLKGPQGTLFGRNATGGLINIVTKDPGRELTGSFDVGYDSYETIRADAYVTGPLTDNLGASLAANYGYQRKGYGRNLTTGQEFDYVRPQSAIRAKLIWQPTGKTTVKITADYSQVDGNDFIGVPILGAQRLFYAPRGGRPWDADSELQPTRTIKAGGGTLTIAQDIGAITLTSISAYRKNKFIQLLDVDNGPLPYGSSYRRQIDDQFSQELQLTGNSERLQWVVGGYYLDSTTKGDPFDVRTAGGLGSSRALTLARLDGKSGSIFGQATVKIADATRFTAGLRYTSESQKVVASQDLYTGGNINSTGTFIRSNYVHLTQKIRSEPLTWRFALDQHFTPDVLGYVSYNRGFKSGGFSLQNPNQIGYRPERLDAYEAGVKSEFLDHHARLNVAGFCYDYRNMQVFTIQTGTAQTYNGARARLYGLDADLDIRVTKALTVSGGLTLVHDRFTNFPLALLSSPRPSGGYALVPGSARGNRIPNAADVSGVFSADYVVPVGANEILFNVSYQYSSGFYGEPDNRLRQSAYHIVNTSIEFRADNRHLHVRLWAKNLANEAVATSLTTASFAAFEVVDRPRTYGVTAGFDF